MRRRKAKVLPSDSSDDDEPLAKRVVKAKPNNDDSSSESDIENYLQPADKINLDSTFFNFQNLNPPPFDEADSDSYAEAAEVQMAVPSTSESSFWQLHDYTKKMEEAKRHVEEYNAKKQAGEKEIDTLNLLAAGETKLNEAKQKILADLELPLHSSDFESYSDSENWEEVEDHQEDKNIIPKEGLQITVEMPGAVKKKKGADLMAAIKRRINRIKKQTQLLIHKVHLLCWIAHGNYVSSVINCENILALALSLVPLAADRTDLNYLEQVLRWFKNNVRNKEKAVPKNKTLYELLEAQIIKKEVYNKIMLVYMFVAILRSLGIQCRLVLSFQLEPARPPKSELLSLSTKNQKVKSKVDKTSTNETIKLHSKGTGKVKATKATEPKIERTIKTRSKSANETTKNDANKKSANKLRIEEHKKTRSKSSSEETKTHQIERTIKTRSKSASEAKEANKLNINKNGKKQTKKKEVEEIKKTRSKTANENTEKTEIKKTKSKNNSKASENKRKENKRDMIKIRLISPKQKSKSTQKLRRQKDSSTIPQIDGADDSTSDDEVLTQMDDDSTSKASRKKPYPTRVYPTRLRTKITSSGDDLAARSPFSPKNKNSPQTSRDVFPKNETQIDRSKMARKRKSTRESDNDSDYAPETIKKQQREGAASKVKVKSGVQANKGREIAAKKQQDVNIWAEVFVETEQKWITVDVINGQIHCVDEIYNRATHPVSYIVAWNNDNSLKDVTSRYCQNFNTVTRSLRVNPKWWEATLKPFAGAKSAKDMAEDDELEKQQLEKPLPKALKEYKNHPLYVLKRHLLKYEAIYPPEAPILGFVRREPVYPRECVYILHPRDIWLKQAKVVKPGEKPYKIVKGRPRWDKLSRKIVTDPEMDIFGPWQIDDYEPPTAENGIVPRNAYGNVELFKPCMLPKKTVHLRLPGLKKIARRMNIDCASAFTGFDYSDGWVHPAYDGYVVCEEYADILVAAWELEQEELEKKEQEKIDKRVYSNWKRLIKGLLIRERLKIKYEFGDTSRSGAKKKAKGGPKFAPKKRKLL